jgi:hypothetical protein
MCGACRLGSAFDVIDELPSAQPEQSDTSEFWRKRADYYRDMCLNLVGEMGKGVKIASVKISENGIEFIKEHPSAHPVDKDINVPANDLISRQEAKNKKVYSQERHEYVIPVAEIDWLPSAQPYTEEEIQAMQDLEQAQLDIAYQIGVEEGLQSAQPEQIARDIATIIENEQDMRVIAEHTETHSCDYKRTETHEWIPVSEALPEDGVTVWVTIRGHDVIRCEDGETLEQAVARISKMRRVSEGFLCEDDKTWYNAGGYPMMVQPIAWMQMEVPEPYKEGQDET